MIVTTLCKSNAYQPDSQGAEDMIMKAVIENVKISEQAGETWD